MDIWIWSGQAALVVGLILFAVAFLPLVALHYHRYGTGDVPRLLVTLAFTVYATALVTYTLFPLPTDPTQWCVTRAVTAAQWQPFRFLVDIARDTGGMSVRGTLLSAAVLQVVFNVVLFVPWGVVARRWWRWSVTASILSGLAVSLLIEVTQYTALWGLYPCRYRLPDVDDLLLNTAGAALGVALAPLLLWWMPEARELEARRGQPRPVTAVRRWLGMAIDLALSTGLFIAVTALVRGMQIALGADPASRPPAGGDVVGIVAVWLVVFVWPAWSRSGASPGHAAVRLTPAWPDARGGWTWGTRTQRVLRASILPGALVLSALSVLGNATGGLLLVAAFCSVPLTRGRRGLTCVITGAQMLDARTDVLLDDRAEVAQDEVSPAPGW